MKIYDWKKLLICILSGAFLAFIWVTTRREGFSAWIWAIVFVSLICGGIYESMTERGFRKAKEKEEHVRAAYRKRFGKLGAVMPWSVVAVWIAVILTALYASSVWLILGVFFAAVCYQLWLTVILRRDLKRQK